MTPPDAALRRESSGTGAGTEARAPAPGLRRARAPSRPRGRELRRAFQAAGWPRSRLRRVPHTGVRQTGHMLGFG
eukprot:6327596-Alexandrium_andersonii.AAC.1